VPKLFEAYGRVFHPARDTDGNPGTWAEVARRLGTVAHPAMQWHQLVGSTDSGAQKGNRWPGDDPWIGELPLEELDRLCRVLAEHTADPERCFFGLGQINHHDVLETLSAEDQAKPELHLPWGRDHVVFAGPLAAVDQLGSIELKNVIEIVGRSPDGEPVEPPPRDPKDPFWRTAPSLIWPADHSWFVASEVDFDSTLVGGSRELIDAHGVAARRAAARSARAPSRPGSRS
jgi:hypothetical protein